MRRSCSRRHSKRARQKGYEKFFTYVRADNEAGLQTYLRQGFRIVGSAERHAKIDGRYIDEIVIEKVVADQRLATGQTGDIDRRPATSTTMPPHALVALARHRPHPRRPRDGGVGRVLRHLLRHRRPGDRRSPRARLGGAGLGAARAVFGHLDRLAAGVPRPAA